MNLEAARIQINELSEKLRYYNQRYYQDSVSEISDFEFDQLLEKLISLEIHLEEEGAKCLRLPNFSKQS